MVLPGSRDEFQNMRGQANAVERNRERRERGPVTVDWDAARERFRATMAEVYGEDDNG